RARGQGADPTEYAVRTRWGLLAQTDPPDHAPGEHVQGGSLPPIEHDAASRGHGHRGLGSVDRPPVDRDLDGPLAEQRGDLLLGAQDPREIVTKGDMLTGAQDVRRPGQRVTEGQHFDLVHGDLLWARGCPPPATGKVTLRKKPRGHP